MALVEDFPSEMTRSNFARALQGLADAKATHEAIGAELLQEHSARGERMPIAWQTEGQTMRRR